MNPEQHSAPAPERFVEALEDGAFAGWRWAREGAPPLLFCHATGFCASAYKQMLAPLAAQFDVYALDMRGHGLTSAPADPATLRSWTLYARDAAAFLDRRSPRGWTLAGHSMGAVVAVMAARGREDVSALKLIEPVAVPPRYALLAHLPFWNAYARRSSFARKAAGRRESWRSRADAEAAYGAKPVFSGWAPGVLADYLEDGLVEAGEGLRLACAPAWEAATFASFANDFWGALRASPAPAHVLAAAPPRSTVSPGSVRRFSECGAKLRIMTEVTHFLPMERPDLAAEFIAGEG